MVAVPHHDGPDSVLIGRDRHPASENLTRMLGKGGTHHPSHFDLIPKIGPRCREPAGSILLAKMRLRRPTHAARQDARGDGKKHEAV